ncbi:winged helix-turn-helix transcriptional regulator [Nocardia sp. NPDC055321]
MDTTLDLRDFGGANAYLRDCPARMVLNLIADKWALLVIAALGGGTLRYGELRRRLEGISPKMLSQTLRSLERSGLLTRTQHPTIPPRVEYTLTSLGESLRTPTEAFKNWAEQNVAQILAAQDQFDTREPPEPWHGR